MSTYNHHIALLGGGTIGLSMAVLHLRRPDTKVTLYDPRPDIEAQVREILPVFLDTNTNTNTNTIDNLLSTNRLTLTKSIQQAVQSATIIQEQSPEVTASKQALWKEVSRFASPSAKLWSSSSGIAASAQGALCDVDIRERLIVAHPFNPPHLMPLLEVVPGPETLLEEVEYVQRYFKEVPGPGPKKGSVSGNDNENAGSSTGQYYRPVVLHKEVPGFVGNRLAFALLREACYLVGEGVISVRDLDELMMASLGPRWAGSGLFESYHAGGGEGGIGAFLKKLAPTMSVVWGELGQVDVSVDGDGGPAEGWRGTVVQQAEEAYGPSSSVESKQRTQAMLRGVIQLQKESGK
ncbi:Dehydrogenase multihelical [Penicillium angulare]|uniref:Dehydrogenase multihelical n=1 Tax=Penicillium angulare TaxID=116970 RepID=UPI002540A7ED|nr:Dehydrogenase multihelical [Penicillium angulare]KAJ5291737.1 Dehydrogenase multihelical [Penicillium angulare]